MKKIIAISLIVIFCAGCMPHYVTWDSSKSVFLINEGDKIIRKDIKPTEVIAGFDGEFISENEIMRLRKIEEDYYLEINP